VSRHRASAKPQNHANLCRMPSTIIGAVPTLPYFQVAVSHLAKLRRDATAPPLNLNGSFHHRLRRSLFIVPQPLSHLRTNHQHWLRLAGVVLRRTRSHGRHRVPL